MSISTVQNVARFLALGYMGTGIASIAVSVGHVFDGECIEKGKAAPLGMWLTVAGVTLIIYSLLNLYEIQKMPEMIAAAMQEGGKKPNNPLMSLLGCFWGIWFIMGNVYFFFYTPETTFDNGPKTNSSSTVSDAHATSCATLEAFGFTFLICLWVVPCVLAICLQTMAAQAMMSHMAGQPTAAQTRAKEQYNNPKE